MFFNDDLFYRSVSNQKNRPYSNLGRHLKKTFQKKSANMSRTMQKMHLTTPKYTVLLLKIVTERNKNLVLRTLARVF